MLQYCFCFYVLFSGQEACGILALWPGIETVPLHWKGKSHPLDSQGNLWAYIFWTKKQVKHLPWGMMMDQDIWNPVCSGKCRASKVVLLVKNQPANAGDLRDTGSIPEWGISSEGGHGNPLQYSCLENPIDRGAWRTMVCRVTKSWTRLKWHSVHHAALESITSMLLSVRTDVLSPLRAGTKERNIFLLVDKEMEVA